MQNRTLRNLSRLQNSGATSRVLNLHRVERRHGASQEHRARPLFRSPFLNTALIVKHRLREHERELFDDYRANATKIILPINREDLRSGAQYAFVDQRGFDPILANLVGDGVDGLMDRKTLSILDSLPSFDPFLLRERLRSFDIDPAACYFDISEADLRRMFAFLQGELRQLVGLSMGPGGGANLATSTASLAQKILSNSAGEDTEPLRLTLRLERSDYVEGVFCWKGFLYYKWKLTQLKLAGPALADQIKAVVPVGRAEPDAREYIRGARIRIVKAIVETRAQVEESLKVYDRAYARLIEARDPGSFRDFLLQAPTMFVKLGERLGVIDHVASFWAYRFPPGRPPAVSAAELMDIFLDFEESLGLAANDGGRNWGTAEVLLAS